MFFKFTAPILATSLLLTIGGCAGHSKQISANQLPENVKMVVDREVGDGFIEEIQQKERSGVRSYEVEYTKNRQEMELELDQNGKILTKEED